ncbi:MAG: adhesion component ABC transporter permease [Myxococcales bacterium]
MSALRNVLFRLGVALASVVLSLVYIAALLLRPWRIGRLLSTVSIPRFHEHRLRTTLTILGISLGVAVLIAVVLVNRSILSGFEGTVADLSGKVDLEVTGSGTGFDEERLYDIKEVPGVHKATPVVRETAVLRQPGAEGEHLLILGVDFLGEDDEHFREYDSDEMERIKAEPFSFLNSPTNIIVSRALADRFGYVEGDTVPLATPEGTRDFTIWGFIEAEGVGRAFGGSIAVMYYQAMQVAWDRGSNVDAIDVAIAPGADRDTVARAIEAAMGPGFEAASPERSNDRVRNMLAPLNSGLMMSSLIALLVGMFLIYNTMSISVVQRKREIGILRSLGTTRRQILALFTLEGLLLGVIGSAIGVGVGVLLARGLLDGMTEAVSELYVQTAATGVRADPLLLVGGFLTGIAGAVAASLVPARAATRITPMETIRSGGSVPVVTRHRFAASDALGLALLLAAWPLLLVPPEGDIPVGGLAANVALTLGVALLARRGIQLFRRTMGAAVARPLGIEGRMSLDNLERDLGRAGITTAALTIGVSMAVSLTVFLGSFRAAAFDWVEQTIPADLFITSAARFSGTRNAPMADVLTDELAALPGVLDVERVRIVDIDRSADAIKLLSTDIAIIERRATLTFLEGSREEALPAMRSGGVLLSENLSRRRDLHVGDTFELPTPAGRQTFPVVGVVVDYTSDRGMVLMDRPVYVERWGDARVDTYKLYLPDGTDLEPLRRTINERWGEKYNLFVLTDREFREEISRILDQTFQLMTALELVALIIALLGVVNTLLASVLDRTREIGVLRAIGMLRRQVRKLVMAEAGLLGTVSVVLGMALGFGSGLILLQSISLVSTGWYFPLRPPAWNLVQTAILVIGVSVVAGWYPAREAARMPVTDALEYE